MANLNKVNPQTKKGITITFDPSINIRLIAGTTIKLTSLTLLKYEDNPSAKTVKAYTVENGSIVLWSGDEYDSIGQWTDIDAQNRIKQLLTQKSSELEAKRSSNNA
jgi:hypothetical protein